MSSSFPVLIVGSQRQETEVNS